MGNKWAFGNKVEDILRELPQEITQHEIKNLRLQGALPQEPQPGRTPMLESQSKISLRKKRLANVALRNADNEAANDAPWAIGNLRMWQNLYVSASKERNAVLLRYLAERAAR